MCANFPVVFVIFHHSAKHVKAGLQLSTPGHTVAEDWLTDKEPNQQRCKTGEEKDPHKDPDQDARLLFGRLLLSAGEELDLLMAAILALMEMDKQAVINALLLDQTEKPFKLSLFFQIKKCLLKWTARDNNSLKRKSQGFFKEETEEKQVRTRLLPAVCWPEQAKPVQPRR